ncbi:MAG: efflux RND transporter periplasmic adaptor subunit [Marinilabilia sp.]
MKTIKYISLIFFVALLASCSKNENAEGHAHDAAEVEEQSHDDHEDVTISHTLFSDDFELFVEFPALISGQTSTFAAHFTRLNNYKPVKQGKVTVSIVKDGQGLRHQVDAPSSPGIFRPSLQPKEPGTYKMLFELRSDSGKVAFEIPDVKVYANPDEAAHTNPREENGDAITFLKEQAWKTKFATQTINRQPFYSVIRTSAKVKSQPRAETNVNAQAEGTINLLAVLGEPVSKGDLLAVVSGSGIENNLSRKLKESKIAFEKSKSDFNRTKPLAEDQIISQKDYLEVQSRYRQDSLRYHQLESRISQNGMKITAPTDGFVNEIKATNGSFVKNGSPVVSLANQSQILIEAYVNQSDYKMVPEIFDAHFSSSEMESPVSLDDIQGKVVSKTPFVMENKTRIPVLFSGKNKGQFMPGMFLEAYLKTGSKEDALVVPLSAIIEEQGQHFVFVQTGGESFEKRQVTPANNDGMRTEIKSGLKPDERIVSEGAYQIKLAAMAGELPLHGHTH